VCGSEKKLFQHPEKRVVREVWMGRAICVRKNFPWRGREIYLLG